MDKRTHGPAFRRELKFIVECNVCLGKGIRIGLFHQIECEHCHGSGWVCGETLQTLPLSDVVPVLNTRLREALAEIAKARQSLEAARCEPAGAQQQYLQNNRRGAGGTNYTGD